MKKRILVLLLALLVGVTVLAPSGEVWADGENNGGGSSCDVEFLGLRPWYYGLTDESCNIKPPDTGCQSGQTGCDATKAGNGIATFIWTIILNVLVDIFMVAGMAALGFLIYGGYLYLRSGGDPNFAAKGKKTIIASLTGLIIVTLANIISRLIVMVITAS